MKDVMTPEQAEMMLEEIRAQEREGVVVLGEALKDLKTLLHEMEQAFNPVLRAWMRAHGTLVHSVDLRSPRHWPKSPRGSIPQDAYQLALKVSAADEAIRDIEAHLDNLKHIVKKSAQ